MNKYPFESVPSSLVKELDRFVDATFETLSSFYLELPQGDGFADFDQFEQACNELFTETGSYELLEPATVLKLVLRNPMVLVVLRCILGLSPPELADLTTDLTGVDVGQNDARGLDKTARTGGTFDRLGPKARRRVEAMVHAACEAIRQGPPRRGRPSIPAMIHRLDKVDTASGLDSVRLTATGGVAYSVLLYERLLGRPFASYRDSVSEMVGDLIEDAVVQQLDGEKILHHKTGRAERVEGFDQAPDFLIPSKHNPEIVIEAKLTQDDGTARDKVTRVQHLDRLSNGGKNFQVVACIDGRGFRIRREDMKKLLMATKGKVFTLATIDQLVEQTRLKDFRGTRR